MVLVVVAIIGYLLLNKKKETPKMITTSQESTTGVSALFNTGAMTSLFGSLSNPSTTPKSTTPIK